LQLPLQASTSTGLPDPIARVKTPGGRHFTDEIKAEIEKLTAEGLWPAQIAKRIPGLSRQQVNHCLRIQSGAQDAAHARLARQWTGNNEATAADYRRIRAQVRRLNVSAQ
jgi:hypothetical protein